MYYASLILDFVFYYSFAIQYMKAALNLPIIMDIFSKEAESKLKRSKKLIFSLNLSVILMVITIVGMQEYRNKEDNKIIVWGIVTLQVLSVFILLSSIHRLGKLIKRFDKS